MGHAVRANAIRYAAERTAALAAGCRNLRRGSFMAMLLELEHLSSSYPEAALMSAYVHQADMRLVLSDVCFLGGETDIARRLSLVLSACGGDNPRARG